MSGRCLAADATSSIWSPWAHRAAMFESDWKTTSTSPRVSCAESNTDQVGKIVRILNELSLEIATPERSPRNAT